MAERASMSEEQLNIIRDQALERDPVSKILRMVLIDRDALAAELDGLRDFTLANGDQLDLTDSATVLRLASADELVAKKDEALQQLNTLIDCGSHFGDTNEERALIDKRVSIATQALALTRPVRTKAVPNSEGIQRICQQ